MRLRTPGTLDAAIGALEDLVRQAGNIVGSWYTLEQGKTDYLQWVERYESIVANYFVEPELLDGVRAGAYWHIYRLTQLDPRPYPMIERELNVQKARLGKAIERLRALEPFLARPGTIVMPDTSAFVEGQYFKDFDWAGADPVGQRFG
jgi:hypothetical protein